MVVTLYFLHSHLKEVVEVEMQTDPELVYLVDLVVEEEITH